MIETYDLGGMVRWILENNPSQALPYHNFNHSLWVANYVQDIHLFEADGEPPARELVVAALFHDFDHSGGFFTDDSQNIERTIAGFSRWCAENFIGGDFYTTASDLIRWPQYPFREKSPSLEIACLRDADMMQNCNDTLLANFVGIKQELYKYDSYADYTEKSLAFLRGIRYETEYGQQCGTRLYRAIAELEQFQRLVFQR
jgi:hypothetical protein